jgi:hypothetical protein
MLITFNRTIIANYIQYLAYVPVVGYILLSFPLNGHVHAHTHTERKRNRDTEMETD